MSRKITKSFVQYRKNFNLSVLSLCENTSIKRLCSSSKCPALVRRRSKSVLSAKLYSDAVKYENVFSTSWMPVSIPCLERRNEFPNQFHGLHTRADSNNHVQSPWQPVDFPEVSVGEYLMKRLEEFGQHEAVVDIPTSRRFTFLDLRDSVIRVSSGLQKLGIEKGDVICVCANNCLEYVVLAVATLNIGAVLSPVNPDSTSEDFARQFAMSGAIAVVSNQDRTSLVNTACSIIPNIKIKISIGEADGWLPFSRLMEDDGSAFTKPVDVNPKEDIAFLPYSSGTTGLPKGVMLTHYNLLSNMLQFSRSCPSAVGRDKVLAYLPFFHIYGFNLKILYCLNEGACLVVIPRFSDQFLDIMEQERISIFHLVPPVCLYVSKHPRIQEYDLSAVDFGLIGAAPVGKQLLETFQDLVGTDKIYQGYGLTETSPIVSVDSYSTRVGSVGQPLANTTVKVIDPTSGELLGPDETGEIHIRGPQVMKGYLGNREATENTLKDGWLVSGDLGHFDKDGYVYVTDRLKELIKYKAKQVAPAELEAVLVTHPAVLDAAVIGLPDPEVGELPTAYVVLKPDHINDIKPEDINSYVNDRVAPAKKIRGGVHFVEQIPKSPSGKILRRILKQSVL